MYKTKVKGAYEDEYATNDEDTRADRVADALGKIIGYLIGGAFAVGMFCLLTLYGALAQGFVIKNFWIWFVQPTFTGLPLLSYEQCVGLSLILLLFRSRGNKETQYYKGEKIKTKTSWGALITGPWVLLGMGYIIHLFLK